MITFKGIIVPNNRRKDGTYPVKIRVTYKGVVRRLPTTLVCTPGDLTRGLKIKNPTILTKCEAVIAQMREAVSELTIYDLEGKDVDWVVQHIKDKLTGAEFQLDFFTYADSFILTKGESTRRAYSCALNTFARFLGERSIDINDINRKLLLDFMEFVDNEPKVRFDYKTRTFQQTKTSKVARGASSRHISKLEHIFNSAKDKYNDEDSGNILIPKAPFSKIVKFIPAPNGQSNLGAELMQRIISYQVDSEPMRVALDAFIVSFGLMGANLADLYCSKPFKGNTWVYNRIKTENRRADHAEMVVEIPQQLMPFIERLKGKGAWWLNVLHDYAGKKDLCTQRVNRYLKVWCEANEVEPFTFYAARHTWASLARKAGVDKSTIDECLVHVGEHRLVDIYAERSWELLQEANKKVIELFDWE